MEPKKSFHYPTKSSEQGFILVFMLMILAVVLGLTMASASITLYHMKSSNAFYRIIKNQLFSPSDGPMPPSGSTMFGAPEGWDHISFSTRITMESTGAMQSYSWRVAMREQCPDTISHLARTAQRPHLVVIIDDSMTMEASSGCDFDKDALYARWSSGSITRLSDACEINDACTLSGCTYFRGSWGNAHQSAPDLELLTGSMSMWAKHFSSMQELVESLDLCEVSLMSTSSGTILPFTMDRREIVQCLDGLYPRSSTCPLSEVLYQATSLFPPHCVSSKHIILVTAGIPVNDGHLPSWLRDFDHDGNTKDTFFEKEGSHCLDDVSSYARSLGISVHVMGPATDFLKAVAAKGGGKILPDREVFAPEQALVTGPPVFFDDSALVLKNLRARLDPPWLKTDKCTVYRQSVTDPAGLVPLPVLAVVGLARSSAADETRLYCTTSRDRLLEITLSTGALTWLMIGVGGEVNLRGGRIMAGPNTSGFITCMDRSPKVLWQQKGDCYDASESVVYAGSGSSVHAYSIEGGGMLAQFDTGHTITVIRYDPCTARVFAGTSDGRIFLFSSILDPAGMITTLAKDAIIEIRPYRLNKELFFIAASTTMLENHTPERPVWAASLDYGPPAGITVINGKVILSTWSEEAPCSGIDTGLSRLEEYDALTGDQTGTEAMFTGRAFGPSVDLHKGILRYVSPTGTFHDRDISTVPGITPMPLGRRLVTHME